MPTSISNDISKTSQGCRFTDEYIIRPLYRRGPSIIEIIIIISNTALLVFFFLFVVVRACALSLSGSFGRDFFGLLNTVINGAHYETRKDDESSQKTQKTDHKRKTRSAS